MPKPHWLLIPLRWLTHLGTWLLAVLVAFEEWGWEPLQRVLARRGVITPTGTTARSGRSGPGRRRAGAGRRVCHVKGHPCIRCSRLRSKPPAALPV